MFVMAMNGHFILVRLPVLVRHVIFAALGNTNPMITLMVIHVQNVQKINFAEIMVARHAKTVHQDHLRPLDQVNVTHTAQHQHHLLHQHRFLPPRRL